MSPTISLPLCIWGSGYSQFLPQWFRGVESLERKIDEIVVVCDEQNYFAVMNSVIDFSKVRIRVETHGDYSAYWNRAFELCQGKWIAICNADDYFLPQALNQIDEADAQGCNLICDHLVHKGTSNTQSAVWRPEELDYAFNLMGANPMTKQLWEAAGGFPPNMRFADWGLALAMRKTNLVNPFYASTTRIVYDVGYDRATMTGASLESEKRSVGNNQVQEFAAKLRQ